MIKKVVLSFPVDATDRSLTYELVKLYDIRINILKAEIQAGKSGRTGSRRRQAGTGNSIPDRMRSFHQSGIQQSFLRRNTMYQLRHVCILLLFTRTDHWCTRLETAFQSGKMHSLQTMPEILPAKIIQN